MKDLVALNKMEMPLWDEWGRMTEAYDGKTGEDYDELLDQLAAVCDITTQPNWLRCTPIPTSWCHHP